MRFVILGAGAMGSLFGARLALTGHDVTLIDVVADHVTAIRERGLTLEQNGTRSTVRVGAATDPADVPAGDVLIVLTKANNLVPALTGAPHLARDSGQTVVLCNGLGCGAAAARLVPPERLLFGATAAGAMLEGPGHVRFTVDAPTYIGPFAGPMPPGARALAEALERAGLPVVLTDQVEEYVWTKLMVNVGYNAATALARVTNGELVRHPGGRAVLEQAVREAMAVAAAKGITIHYDDPVSFVVDLGLNVIGPNRSSMLQDVLRGRETEVAWLNGAVSAEGHALGIPTPVNQVLHALVTVQQESAKAMD